MKMIKVNETLDRTSIASLLELMSAGSLTPSGLLEQTLERLTQSADLNAVVVLDPKARDAARESDQRYRSRTQRPLEGLPFTVKDSYRARGLTVASGSPAFEDLVATSDAFTVETLRKAGAILIGKTNMPPMADGGMQRGVYGRSESPFNPDYLPAAYASGSSHGSAVAVAIGIGAFGMGEETVSSGRSPASNNGICAYTPSRGVLSVRGNWPLFPTRDVAVPHTKTIDDMLLLLDSLVIDDPSTEGDFWRQQSAVPLPRASDARPASYRDLSAIGSLSGMRIAVPTRFLGTDREFPMEVHPEVLQLTRTMLEMLSGAGAELIETDFPLIDEYEGRSQSHEQLTALGGLPDNWMKHEFTTLTAIAWDQFLRTNNDPRLNRIAQVDPADIFPLPPGQLPDRYAEVEDNLNRYDDTLSIARAMPGATDPAGEALSYADVPGFDIALRRLESLRQELLEGWMDRGAFDAVVFPANADVARADSDRNPASADHAWRNGVYYSNGNYALRHLGVPTVTTSMGVMPSIGMPVGVTFAGRAYDDARLLQIAAAYERSRGPRPIPPRLGENA